MLAVILWYLLLGATVITAVALFNSLAKLKNEEPEMIFKVEELPAPEGLSRRELNRIVAKVNREEAKRAKGNRRIY